VNTPSRTRTAWHTTRRRAPLSKHDESQVPRVLRWPDFAVGQVAVVVLTLYGSFAEWEKDNKLVDNSPALGAELERASVVDGELLIQSTRWSTRSTKT